MYRPVFQQLLLGCMMIVCPFAATGNSGKVITPKEIAVAMRMIGDEVLLCLGDRESRVLPIGEPAADQYRISFEKDFAFDPEDLVTIIESVMLKTGAATDYVVEIEQCDTREIVHSFVIRNVAYSDIIPCEGRFLPEASYSILLTLLEPFDTRANMVAATGNSSSGTAARSNDTHPLQAAFFILPVFLLVGIVTYFIRRKQPTAPNPHIIRMGASTFDTRTLELSFDNHRVELSNKEAELLSLLHTHANDTLERDVILQKVWGDEGDYVGRTLDVFISKLRKKLEADASLKIVNVRGVGYRLVVVA